MAPYNGNSVIPSILLFDSHRSTQLSHSAQTFDNQHVRLRVTT
jgi:hypothetical protein